MDNPIVNPVWFYLADIIPTLGVALRILGACSIAFGFMAFAIEDFAKECVSRFKKFVIFGVIITLVGLLCPSKDACYQMVAAKAITPSNIKVVTDYVSDTATNVSDNLTDAIKDIMDYSVDRIYNVRNNEKAGN